jgi:hypothetical protein
MSWADGHMKLPLTLILVLACSVPALADQTTPAKAAEFRSGTTKLKAGAILMAAGTLVIVAGVTEKPGVLGPSALAGGMGLIMWGAKQRSDALRPQQVFGFTVGRKSSVYFSRRW